MSKRKDMAAVNHQTVRRILRYARPYWAWFLLALGLITLTVRLELLQPAMIEYTMDTYVGKYVELSREGLSISQLKNMGQADIQGAALMGVMYLGCSLLIFALTYSQMAILSSVGQKIIYNMRTDVFKHITSLHIGFFNDQPLGSLVTRVTTDCETVLEMFTSVIVNIIGSMFVLCGVMYSMMHRHLGLSLAIFTVIPLIVLCTVFYTRITRKMYRAIRARVSELNGFLAEHISGMRIVQMFSAEEEIQQTFEQGSEDLRKAHMRQLLMSSSYSPVSYLLNIGTMAILLVYGGKLAVSGAITIGTMLAFQRYISRFFQPIQEITENFNVVQSAAAAAERIFWLMDTEPAVQEEENALPMPSFKGHIEFKHVWFAYEEEEWVLRDVSFEVKPGQRIAFVGATGAGKTTIQNLICRYYEIQKGQILIDGTDIRNMKLGDLRKNIGQMLQDVFLFAGDVKSNIRLNNETITDADILSASRYVNADSFISRLEGGYDHPVIERGDAFSAGQRQLLSFARTLAVNPSMLILDEATANIDTETELLIQDALQKLMNGRTTIIVAHRLSTIQSCDQILVMQKGRIVESGTHQQLLSQLGLYYKLYKLQYEHDRELAAMV